MLSEPEVIADIIDMEADEFKEKDCQLIWTAVKYLYETDQPIELPSVVQILKEADRLEEVGGVLRLTDLMNVPTAKNVKYYANIVRQAATLRRLAEKAQEIYSRAQFAAPSEAETLVEEMEKAVESARVNDAKGLIHISDAEESTFDLIEKKKGGIKTGFPLYDKLSGGVHPGWLYVLAGRPSVGKTAKMLQKVFGIARQGAGAVLVFSQEMDKEELLLRVLSSETSVPYNFLTKDKDKLTEPIKKKLRERFKQLRKLPIYVDDSAGKTMSQIKAAIKRFKARKGKIAAVFVDYLQIMNIQQEPGETRAQAVGNVAQQAKELAREHKFAFVMLSQLSRKTEENGVPELGHLKESGGIEQAADVVEFLYEHKDDRETPASEGCKWVRSKIAKGRNIGTFEIKCYFAGWSQRYEEVGLVDKLKAEKKEEEGGIPDGYIKIYKEMREEKPKKKKTEPKKKEPKPKTPSNQTNLFPNTYF
ncbi:AAA family ATPase [Paenactinomyces guangxiensis]|uniref:DNA 5'-3' helicase n=1 Tax=Paenactinomyces guangxiensis TaxID=1490290 RepID=A0A7W2A8Y7_9BACL|nr:AAA family ATPase [Paenactinomyces guangxiensis]MBH8592191.1 AAA family ATPase [Paenactinomyces guangxiensis]